jgi:dTDP-4-dehydrorhamnose reductase
MITGAGGQLAYHLAAQLRAAEAEFVELGIDELDITVPDAVNDAVSRHKPDVLVNAAAYTAVDKAETDEATANAVNETGPALLAAAQAAHGGRLVHISTDYVFAGTATEPYEPDDAVGPRTAYGRTKLAGELAVRAALPADSHVIRTAWVYGGPTPNFVDTMLRLEKERETLTVVADQLGSPTYVDDLAGGIIELVAHGVPAGTLHYTNAGTASWCDLARETFRLVGADPERVRPITTAEYPVPAPRPAWSVLSPRAWIAAGLTAPRPWAEALADHLGRRGLLAG